MIQNENTGCEYLIIQLGAGASSPKEWRQTTAFQRRFETLKRRITSYDICSKLLLEALVILFGRHKR
jgi:hypothetical protein